MLKGFLTLQSIAGGTGSGLGKKSHFGCQSERCLADFLVDAGF
jgi:hypothetical protein